MRLTWKKWQALIFLSIISIVVGGCASQSLPTKLEATKTVLSLGEHTTIECIVSHSTGNLTYEWSSNGGSIQGEGEFVDWFAPDSAGDYTIIVKVEGDNGKTGMASMPITVVENHAPVIEDLVVTAEHEYLKQRETDYLVGKNQTYHIECQAWDEDEDNLVFTWSCDNGEISGTGTKVIWKAPNVDVKVNVTVTVSDGRNGVATQDLLLKVVRCSPCTFR